MPNQIKRTNQNKNKQKQRPNKPNQKHWRRVLALWLLFVVLAICLALCRVLIGFSRHTDDSVMMHKTSLFSNWAGYVHNAGFAFGVLCFLLSVLFFCFWLFCFILLCVVFGIVTAIQNCVAGSYVSTTVEFADAPCWLLYHDQLLQFIRFMHCVLIDLAKAQRRWTEKKKLYQLPVCLCLSTCPSADISCLECRSWVLPSLWFPEKYVITFALRKQSSWFRCLFYTACNGTAMSVGWQPPEHDLPCSTQFHCCSYIVCGFRVQERFGARALSLP